MGHRKTDSALGAFRVPGAAKRWAGLLAAVGFLVSGSGSVGSPDAPSGTQGWPGTPGQAPLLTFHAADANDLAFVLAQAWEGVGPLQVPGLAPTALPGDLRELGAGERKLLFVRSVLPYVLVANDRVRREREALDLVCRRYREGIPPSEPESEWVLGLANRYRDGESAARRLREETGVFLQELLERVDVVPPSLALSQAAIESGWGRSRFSREGNALFGQWNFSRRAGMTPRNRPERATYSVARFETIGHAVDAYLRNLNTHRAYADFRSRRAAMRAEGGSLNSLELARGLLRYSERRQAYVDEVRQIIQDNHMTRFDRSRLAALEPQLADGLLKEPETITRSWPAPGVYAPDA